MNDPFESLRQAFLHRCQALLLTLEGLARSADLGVDPGDHEKLVKAAHSLSGAGGIFGFPDLSKCACQLEDW